MLADQRWRPIDVSQHEDAQLWTTPRPGPAPGQHDHVSRQCRAGRDRLSSILQSFNDLFADADFSEEDRIKAMDNIRGPIMQMLASDSLLEATLRNSDIQNTMVRFRGAFQDALISNIYNNTKMFTTKQQSPSFEQQLESKVFELHTSQMLNNGPGA